MAISPRCTVVPHANHEVSFEIDGQEKLRWHSGTQYPRPFFYPLIGPAGKCLTRMGHPGAPDHDHHRSVWFAHNQVQGLNFWAEGQAPVIRQQQWYAMQDGDEALFACRLNWLDGHDPAPLLDQDVVAALRPGERTGEVHLELQSTFTPRADMLELGKTNFGMLAVRVAKSLSAHFGGGKLTDSEGREGEPAIFGKTARWMDYSGPMPPSEAEGITFFDHPTNHRHPTAWHVRSDGWMGASVCFAEPILLTKDAPLIIRYQLSTHEGWHDRHRAEAMFQQFAARPGWKLSRGTRPHTQWEIVPT